MSDASDFWDINNVDFDYYTQRMPPPVRISSPSPPTGLAQLATGSVDSVDYQNVRFTGLAEIQMLMELP